MKKGFPWRDGAVFLGALLAFAFPDWLPTIDMILCILEEFKRGTKKGDVHDTKNGHFQ